MKKGIVLLCAALLLIFCVPARAEDRAAASSGDFTYVLLEDGTAEIT